MFPTPISEHISHTKTAHLLNRSGQEWAIMLHIAWGQNGYLPYLASYQLTNDYHMYLTKKKSREEIHVSMKVEESASRSHVPIYS